GAPAPALQRLVAAEAPPGAVAGRAEPALLARRRAGHDRGGRPHAAADEDRLADRGERGRKVGMPGAEGARCALAMDEDAAAFAVERVELLLARVVRDVEEKIEPCAGEEVGEHLSREMGDDLSVRERAVDRRAHGAEIALPERGG